MKRRSLVALIMASVVTLSVAGCGGKEDEGEADEGEHGHGNDE